jgi:acyl-CoA reductase-like NAD-dependent aldehyde dehydrogenase
MPAAARQPGLRHTAVIHTNDQRLQQRFAEEIPASRVLVNSPAPMAAWASATAWCRR